MLVTYRDMCHKVWYDAKAKTLCLPKHPLLLIDKGTRQALWSSITSVRV